MLACLGHCNPTCGDCIISQHLDMLYVMHIPVVKLYACTSRTVMFMYVHIQLLSTHSISLFSTADEAEQNFSEDDGWEFVTLADQVTLPVYVRVSSSVLSTSYDSNLSDQNLYSAYNVQLVMTFFHGLVNAAKVWHQDGRSGREVHRHADVGGLRQRPKGGVC